MTRTDTDVKKGDGNFNYCTGICRCGTLCYAYEQRTF